MCFIKENMGQGTMKARPPKEISKILFPTLPFRYVTKKTLFDNKIYHPDIKEESLFISIPEKTAVEIENELKSIEIYLLFNIGGKENVNYKYYCTTNGWYDIKKELLVAKNVRCLLLLVQILGKYSIAKNINYIIYNAFIFHSKESYLCAIAS